MGKLENIVARVSGALFIVASFATLAMMLHVVADVSGKYLFNAPVWGTLETVAGYYMVIVLFLPLAYVARHEGHIIVELFTGRLPARSIAGLEAVVGCFSFAFMCLFTWKTGEEALFRTFQGEVWDIADGSMIIWPSRWVLPIGAGVMTCYVLLQIVGNIKRALRE